MGLSRFEAGCSGAFTLLVHGRWRAQGPGTPTTCSWCSARDPVLDPRPIDLRGCQRKGDVAAESLRLRVIDGQVVSGHPMKIDYVICEAGAASASSRSSRDHGVDPGVPHGVGTVKVTVEPEDGDKRNGVSCLPPPSGRPTLQSPLATSSECKDSTLSIGSEGSINYHDISGQGYGRDGSDSRKG